MVGQALQSGSAPEKAGAERGRATVCGRKALCTSCFPRKRGWGEEIEVWLLCLMRWTYFFPPQSSHFKMKSAST